MKLIQGKLDPEALRRFELDSMGGLDALTYREKIDLVEKWETQDRNSVVGYFENNL